MKLKIEKLATGQIRIELAPECRNKKVQGFAADLAPSMVDVVVQLLQTARSAERFRFEITLPEGFTP